MSISARAYLLGHIKATIDYRLSLMGRKPSQLLVVNFLVVKK